jgi:multicomponent Na+:H+ antiporter subunit D
MAGALLHILFHSVAKSLLFMSAGSIIHQTGKTKVSDLRGVGRQMPITVGCFTLGALSLVGIPPFAGFFSKWYLANGALASEVPVFGWLGPVILLLSALLTAGYLFPISVQGFLPGKAYDQNPGKHCEAGKNMTIPMMILGTLALLLGVFSSGIIDFVSKVAEGLM